MALNGMNGTPLLLHPHSFLVKLAWKNWWGKIAVRKVLQQANLTRLNLSLITNTRGFLLNLLIGNSIWNIFYLDVLTQIIILAHHTPVLALTPTHFLAC